jgi:hypothetical protein
MIDPPSGWKYGFPKALPSEAVIYYGGSDYGVKKSGEQFWCKHWIENED